MEIFPTCIRQSGVGFCSFVSQIISFGGPYVIALGSTNVVVSNSLQGLITEAYFFVSVTTLLIVQLLILFTLPVCL